jgi:hypothetical protein
LSVIGYVVAGILASSLLLLIYSVLSRRKAVFYMLKFMIIVTLVLTPVLAENQTCGLIGIPLSTDGLELPDFSTAVDKPVVIVGNEIGLLNCKDNNADQNCWFEGVVDFLTNNTMQEQVLNQTYA